MISCVCSRSFCRYMSGFKHSKRVDLECVLQSVSTHRLYPQALACITYLKSAQPPSRLECVMNAVPSITGVSRHAHTHTHTHTHKHTRTHTYTHTHTHTYTHTYTTVSTHINTIDICTIMPYGPLLMCVFSNVLHVVLHSLLLIYVTACAYSQITHRSSNEFSSSHIFTEHTHIFTENTHEHLMNCCPMTP